MVFIRPPEPTDAPAISSLVCALADSLLVDREGPEARNFHKTMEPARVAQNMLKPDRFYMLAQEDTEVVGMILIVNNNHIGQFFVLQGHQGRGVGSALWAAALSRATGAHANPTFTVKSSIGAEPVYRRFGFEATGPAAIDAGFRYIPMRRTAAGAV